MVAKRNTAKLRGSKKSKSVTPIFNAGHKDDYARLLINLVGAAIIGFVYYMTGRIELTNWEVVCLFVAIISSFICGYLLRRE